MSKRHHHTRQISASARVARVAILSLAFALRAFSLDAQGLWRDEVDQWRLPQSQVALGVVDVLWVNRFRGNVLKPRSANHLQIGQINRPTYQ